MEGSKESVLVESDEEEREKNIRNERHVYLARSGFCKTAEPCVCVPKFFRPLFRHESFSFAGIYVHHFEAYACRDSTRVIIKLLDNQLVSR